MFGGLKRIAFKLALLAGVPVIGALLLAVEIERSARDRARTAEAIGSIEDLAELSARMTDTVDELQAERALAALNVGLHASAQKDAAEQERVQAAFISQEKKTDAAVSAMDAFLKRRDLMRLPARLGGDLARARVGLGKAPSMRQPVLDGRASISNLLEFYDGINATLIDATAALTGLSDDGELLRALSSLVAMMQVQECESREHSVLNHTFAAGDFAPGLFRTLVTLVTEQAVHVASLESFAAADQVQAYHRVLQLPAAQRSGAMLSKALDATEDNFGIDANEWFQSQRSKVHELAALERDHAKRVSQIATRKLSETRRAVRYGEGLAVGVLIVSLSLALFIGRGITLAVLSLAGVTGRVQREKDYSLRAVKTSQDELGMLTDAFNEMLGAIEARDQELSLHRENLEQLVRERTAELSKRNRDMRLVLDTVEQGLITVDTQGRIVKERSRAFDTFFGPPDPDVLFFEHIAASDQRLAQRLELDFGQIVDGFLPVEVALAQAISNLELGGRNFELAYKPLFEGEAMSGSLLTVSDVTREISARRAEAAQRDQLQAFMRIMNDRAGFLQFSEEASRLLQRIEAEDFASKAEQLRTIHTLKGNAALFHASRVAEAAHALEQIVLDGSPADEGNARQRLLRTWEDFQSGVAPVLGESRIAQSVTGVELGEILEAARQGHIDQLERLIRSIGEEPIRRTLQRISEQLSFVAQRLGKDAPEVLISCADFRLPAQRYQPLWAAFAHVVRNVADHGLEASEERVRAGKPARNRVQLSARVEQQTLVMQVADDGRGVDWARVAVRAQAQGLPHATHADLVEALFAPGVSTSEDVSETSGRGVGMSAVREACRALGGDCNIESVMGQGTTLTLTVRL